MISYKFTVRMSKEGLGELFEIANVDARKVEIVNEAEGVWSFALQGCDADNFERCIRNTDVSYISDKY